MILPDYGISWDESIQRKHGLVALDYIITTFDLNWKQSFPDVELAHYVGRQYMVLYSTICAVLERLIGIEEDFRARYILRHLFIFLLFWGGTIFFYKLLLLRLKDWKLSLLGTVFLILSPRIFAHAFYNPKDMVLLPCYIMGSYTMVRFLQERNLKFAVLHALASAIVINTRIVGVYIPVLTFLLLLLDLIQNRVDRNLFLSYLRTTPVYLCLTGVLSYAFFPYLWAEPYASALESFNTMANFSWGSQLLYFGKFIPGEEVPWYYIPSWIGLTTPVFYLFLFFIGLIFVAKSFLLDLFKKRFWGSPNHFLNLVFMALCVGPWLAVVYKESTLYNGWRQMFFIYPAIIGVSMVGFKSLLELENNLLKKSLFVIASISLFFTFSSIIRNHPHQHVYFNFLAKKDLTHNFDMDYWGLAYKQAFQELIRRDSSALIQVNCANYPCEENFRFLPDKIKARLKLRYGPEVADYFLSNFRRPEEYEKFKNQEYPYTNEFFSIDVEGNKVIGVYRLR